MNNYFKKYLCSLLFLLISLQFLPGQETPTTERSKKEIEPLSEASRIWLEEVVAYILNDAEKEIFINLPTEIERRRFIENFWKRRDPNPSTPENEFKDEYYRRIALANEFFGSSAIEGWRTDRGKIFILLGPPNEIRRDLNSSDFSSRVFHGPKETWNYWNPPNPKLPPNLEFVFVDRLGTGHFVLDMSLRLWHGGEFDLDDISYTFDYMENISEAMKNPFENLDKLRGMITTQVTYDQIPFEYRLFCFRGPEKTIRVPIVIEIPYRAITQKKIENKHHYSLTLVVNAGNPLGQIVFEKSKDINFEHPPRELASNEDEVFRIQTTLNLEPRVTTVHLLIHDRFSGKVGTSHEEISLPEFIVDDLVLSDIILFSGFPKTEKKDLNKQEGKNEEYMFSEIRNVFQKNQELNVFFEVYNLSLDTRTRLNKLIVRYSFLLDGTTIAQVSPLRPEHTEEQDCSIQTSFRLKNFRAGEYFLRIEVVDEKAGRTVEKEIPFRVIQ